MPISTVSGASSVGAGSNLSLQDFMQVLMAQLSYQNPLQPMDNQAFLAQIAQFTALGQTQEINANLQTLIGNQAAEQGVGLLSRTVQFTAASGTMTGTVSQIDISGSTPKLTITTTSGTVPDVSLSQIIKIN